jgi:hypothetical protein
MQHIQTKGKNMKMSDWSNEFHFNVFITRNEGIRRRDMFSNIIGKDKQMIEKFCNISRTKIRKFSKQDKDRELERVYYDTVTCSYLVRYIVLELLPNYANVAGIKYDPVNPSNIDQNLLQRLPTPIAAMMQDELRQISILFNHCIACIFNGKWQYDDNGKLEINIPTHGHGYIDIGLNNFYKLNQYYKYICKLGKIKFEEAELMFKNNRHKYIHIFKLILDDDMNLVEWQQCNAYNELLLTYS